MNTTKPKRKSLTLQAVAVTIAVIVYDLVGAGMYGLPDLPDVLLQALTGAGLLVAGYGRIRAKDKLK